MSPAFWAKAHGAATHFPVVLSLAAFVCDTVAVIRWEKPAGPALRAAGAVLLGVAALSTLPAVTSGLVLTRGEAWGAGVLRWHHLFVWPAFALVIGAAVWRRQVRGTLSRRGHAVSLVVIGSVAMLMLGAARWGGELLQSFP